MFLFATNESYDFKQIPIALRVPYIALHSCYI